MQSGKFNYSVQQVVVDLTSSIAGSAGDGRNDIHGRELHGML